MRLHRQAGRALGADGLNALAERVFALVPLYSSALSRQAMAPVALRSRPPGPLDLARGLAYSSPWLVSLATLLIAGVSFWSSNIAIPSIADAVTLATAVALLVTGPFIQAFGRRASFYIGLGDQGMVIRITRWTLELGLVVTALSGLALYLVRNDVLGAGTPATARLGLAAAISIAALQVGLAAFYVRRAFLSIGVIVGGGAAVLFWFVSRSGSYIDPTSLIVWQIRLVAIMAGVCWMASAWWLLRVKTSAPAPLWRPSGSALLRAVAPYGLYGLGLLRHRGHPAAGERRTAPDPIHLQCAVRHDQRRRHRRARAVAGPDRRRHREPPGTAVPGVVVSIHRGPDR